VTEADLAALGLHRIAIPIPFVAAGGPVNVYLIENADGSLTLFDAGLGTEEARAALLAGFRRLGRRLEEVSRIVVSHGHVDHFGAAAFIREQQGGTLTVHAHPRDLPKIDETGPSFKALRPAVVAHFARLGVPAEVIQASARAGETSYAFARRVAGVRPLEAGQRIEGRQVSFEVLHLPGHTPGLVALHEPRLGLLLPADHLLEKISPNPLIELGPDGQDGFFRPLLTYLESLERTRALELELVLPGHGPPFGGHRTTIDRLKLFYLKRQERLAALLEDRACTAWELCQALFPTAKPGDTYLTLSETVANLEVLQSAGTVVRRAARDGWTYALAGGAASGAGLPA
jgi:glyoxylase-like metal-dependent hydrolase (beta-lactamase superfamily II)